jgi:hypothetical protein
MRWEENHGDILRKKKKEKKRSVKKQEFQKLTDQNQDALNLDGPLFSLNFLKVWLTVSSKTWTKK